MAFDSLQQVSDQLAAMVEKVTRSVARVEARQRLAGSGIVWSSEGVIVTADHVVEREENIRVQLDGQSYEAELAGRDPSTDLAVLKIQANNLVPANIAEAQNLKAGHMVFAVGRPWSDDPIVSAGIVSAVGRFGFTRGWGEQFREGLIHADVVLYPGFSGGPLADASGRVVGLNTSVIGRGMSLAVPSETISRVAEELLREGKIKRGYLGVGVQKIPLQQSLRQKLGLEQETGLVVLQVEAGSGAERGGILPGDIIVGLNGTNIGRLRELNRWLSTERGGREVRARVIRGGEFKELNVVVGSR